MPLTIFAPDAPRWALDLIEKGVPLIDMCPGTDGTVVISRYTRFFWEVVLDGRWKIFSKGGGFKRWYGLNYWVIDWRKYGDVIEAYALSRYPKEKLRLVIKDKEFINTHGITYTSFANRSLAVRSFEKGSVPSNRGPCFCSNEEEHIHSILSFLNSNHSNRLIRLISPSVEFGFKYVAKIPIFPKLLSNITLINCAKYSIELKKFLAELNIIEFNFNDSRSQSNHLSLSISSYEMTLISLINREISKILRLDQEEHEALFIETGTPTGWFPLIVGYDTLPSLHEELPEPPTEVLDYLAKHEHRGPDVQELAALKNRLRALFEAGPGAKEDIDDDADNENNEEDCDQVAVTVGIPIPAETFLEDLSQRMEIHPISIYWLLKEGIEEEGWRCLPEERRITKDRYTVMILRLLGHRWPKQIEGEEPVPEWADEDGIIPLTEGTDESTLYARLRARLAAEYGDERVSSEENAFEEVIGKPLSEWVRRDFFRHHISQFKKRPIAWHISSGRWNGRPRQEPAFECFVYYHKTDGDLLHKIRNQYVGPLTKRLDLELRGLENGSGSNLSGEQEIRRDLLRDQIPELKAFDSILSEIIATGFGPESMKTQLRQYALNDAMLCLKARWLKKLSGVIQDGPLKGWVKQADQTKLHENFSTWIIEAMTHLDHHCVVVGPAPPEEKMQEIDPTAKDLAQMICEQAGDMMKGAIERACGLWWKSFDKQVLKPVSEKIKAAKKELQALKDKSSDPKNGFKEQSDIKREMKTLKSDIKIWQNELAL